MPVCIAGMHRSGTSMVANLLYLCGLYLGPEEQLMPPSEDNEKGYWESLQLTVLNEEILQALGGFWDAPPPLLDGWHRAENLAPFRSRAEAILREFNGREPWGWKDPRNCLTLPFWQDLLPGLKVVLCLRNPLEVAFSLRRRKFTTHQSGLSLWWLYNQSALEAASRDDRIVTHYESYFRDPRRELERVLAFLQISATEPALEQCAATISSRLRHSEFRTETLLEESVTPDVFELYMELCDEARFRHH